MKRNSTVFAIIQARMGSTRLPGKVLSPILGKPMIQWQVERLSRSRFIDRIVIATSVLMADDPLAEFCVQAGWDVFRGDEADVLGRFHAATLKLLPASEREKATIVRLTGDCPLVDPMLIDEGISQFLGFGTTGCRYLGYDPDLPDGMDFEVFSWTALDQASLESRDPFEREHVTPYLWRNPELFGMKRFTHPGVEAGLRFSVDYPEDRCLVEEILKRQEESKRFFGINEISALLRDDPVLRNLNLQIIKNEGLLKTSLASPVAQVLQGNEKVPGYGIYWGTREIDLDLADWAHSMGIRAWVIGDPGATKLREHYTSKGGVLPLICDANTTSAGWTVIHFEGDWQTALEARLRDDSQGKVFLAVASKQELAQMLTYVFQSRFLA